MMEDREKKKLLKKYFKKNPLPFGSFSVLKNIDYEALKKEMEELE